MTPTNTATRNCRAALEAGDSEAALTYLALACLHEAASGKQPQSSPTIRRLASAIKTLHKIQVWAEEHTQEALDLEKKLRNQPYEL